MYFRVKQQLKKANAVKAALYFLQKHITVRSGAATVGVGCHTRNDNQTDSTKRPHQYWVNECTIWYTHCPIFI
jgi:hypothetical protein